MSEDTYRGRKVTLVVDATIQVADMSTGHISLVSEEGVIYTAFAENVYPTHLSSEFDGWWRNVKGKQGKLGNTDQEGQDRCTETN